MVKIKSFILLNNDTEVLPENIDRNTKVITYGLSSKSTITASSIGEDEVSVCIQRGFTNANGALILPQEITVKINQDEDVSDVLCETAIDLVIGLKHCNLE